MAEYGLGRRFEPDPRDWSVREVRLLAPRPSFARRLLCALAAIFRPVPDAPAWADPLVLDQGSTGTCVGQGWAGWLAAAPVEDTVDESVALAIYREATCGAGACDDTLEAGSTVRDGAKAVQARGRLAGYGFAASVAEMIGWLRDHGPIVMGTNWYTAMFSPGARGLLRIAGDLAGGHCYLCLDYEPATDTFLFVNSWGRGWGEDGRFRLRSSDVARLLREQGEACCAVELPLA